MPRTMTKEELEVEMTQFNKRLEFLQQSIDDVNSELGNLFEELGDLLRPIIRDYYSMDSSEETKK